MQEVGASEAESRLGQLLDLVERGEEVVIMRHGKAVARLVAPRPDVDRKEARAALARLRARAEALNLGPFDWTEWKAYRDEGRP